jgi:hypothetical protein
VAESVFDIAAHPASGLLHVKAAVGRPEGFKRCSSSDFSMAQACIDARPEMFYNDSDCDKYGNLDIWAACFVQAPCASFRDEFILELDICTSEIFNEDVSVFQDFCSLPLCNIVTARNRDCASIPSSKSPPRCVGSSTALIIGACVGGVVLLGAVVGSVIFMKRRSSAAAVKNNHNTLTPQV